MTHQMDWLISDLGTIRASLKHQIKQDEATLHQYYDSSGFGFSSEESLPICRLLITRYKEFLKLLDSTVAKDPVSLADADCSLQTIYEQIRLLRKKLFKLNSCDEEKIIVMDLIVHYKQLEFHLVATLRGDVQSAPQDEAFSEFKRIFEAKSAEDWLERLIYFFKNHSVNLSEFIYIYFKSHPAVVRLYSEHFSNQCFVAVFNSIFYYKLHPEALFEEGAQPEKLLSIRSRLDAIYQLLEMMQSQLVTHGAHQGLEAMNDYFFHGDELPEGANIQPVESAKACIQRIVKAYKPRVLTNQDKQIMRIKLYDLYRAYKFWFNPARLLDAIMVLQQLLVHQRIEDEFNESQFRLKMVELYQQMKTTECLDLYGYFSNKDSAYLLRALNAVTRGKTLSWLPPITKMEKKAVLRVFLALRSTMAALREVLLSRSISTNPYPVNFSKPIKKTGSRIQLALLRVIELYGGISISENHSVEELFNLVENTQVD